MSKAKTVLNASNDAITNTEANKKFHQRIADISGSLRGIHKYQCASDEHRADLEKDAGLTPIPHQEIYGPGVSTPDGLTSEQRKEFFEAEMEQRGATPEKWEEYHEACDQHGDAEIGNEVEQADDIAIDIINAISESACEHCGETHSDVKSEYGYRHDHILMALFRRTAEDMLNRGLFNNVDRLIEEVRGVSEMNRLVPALTEDQLATHAKSHLEQLGIKSEADLPDYYGRPAKMMQSRWGMTDGMLKEYLANSNYKPWRDAQIQEPANTKFSVRANNLIKWVNPETGDIVASLDPANDHAIVFDPCVPNGILLTDLDVAA